MARYDRIASLPPPARDEAFPGWPVLRDLESRERDPDLGRRVRLRFLALRPVRRLLAQGVDAVPADSFDRQVEGVREELGLLPARDPERIRLTRFLRQVRLRTPLALTTATLDLGEMIEAAGHLNGAAECYRIALEIAEAYRLDPEQVTALRLLGGIHRKSGRWDDAEKAFRLAVDLAHRLTHPQQWTRSAEALALVLRERGRPDEAGRLYERMLEHAVEHAEPTLYADALVGICLAKVEAGDLDAAIEHGWEAIGRTTDEAQRTAVIHALGLAFAGLGLNDAAERCQQVLADRVRERPDATPVRWPAPPPPARPATASVPGAAPPEPPRAGPPSDAARRIAAEVASASDRLVPASG